MFKYQQFQVRPPQPQTSDTQPKVIRPPPHLIKQTKKSYSESGEGLPQNHENMNVSNSPINKNKKQETNPLTLPAPAPVRIPKNYLTIKKEIY